MGTLANRPLFWNLPGARWSLNVVRSTLCVAAHEDTHHHQGRCHPYSAHCNLLAPNDQASAARRCFWRRVGWMPGLGLQIRLRRSAIGPSVSYSVLDDKSLKKSSDPL